MKKIAILVLLAFLVVLSYQSCQNLLQQDGNCTNCAGGNILFNKTCYPPIRGCLQYLTGEKCLNCQFGYKIQDAICQKQILYSTLTQAQIPGLIINDKAVLTPDQIVQQDSLGKGQLIQEINNFLKYKYSLSIKNSLLMAIQKLEIKNGIVYTFDYELKTNYHQSIVFYNTTQKRIGEQIAIISFQKYLPGNSVPFSQILNILQTKFVQELKDIFIDSVSHKVSGEFEIVLNSNNNKYFFYFDKYNFNEKSLILQKSNRLGLIEIRQPINFKVIQDPIPNYALSDGNQTLNLSKPTAVTSTTSENQTATNTTQTNKTKQVFGRKAQEELMKFFKQLNPQIFSISEIYNLGYDLDYFTSYLITLQGLYEAIIKNGETLKVQKLVKMSNQNCYAQLMHDVYLDQTFKKIEKQIRSKINLTQFQLRSVHDKYGPDGSKINRFQFENHFDKKIQVFVKRNLTKDTFQIKSNFTLDEQYQNILDNQTIKQVTTLVNQRRGLVQQDARQVFFSQNENKYRVYYSAKKFTYKVVLNKKDFTQMSVDILESKVDDMPEKYKQYQIIYLNQLQTDKIYQKVNQAVQLQFGDIIHEQAEKFVVGKKSTPKGVEYITLFDRLTGQILQTTTIYDQITKTAKNLQFRRTPFIISDFNICRFFDTNGKCWSCRYDQFQDNGRCYKQMKNCAKQLGNKCLKCRGSSVLVNGYCSQSCKDIFKNYSI